MKRQAIFMALLALAFQAQAVPVSVDEAARAARAWVFRGGTLGARLGDVVERATTQTLPSGAKVHAVQMRGGGAVFLSSDTELAPVIAFTSDDADYSQIDPKSPLWALLCRDARARGAAVKQAVTASVSGGASVAASASGSAASRQWAALLAEGAALDDPTVRQPARAHVLTPGDLRAGPLVQSAWNQGAVGGKDCYNRYTPVLSDGARAVCGCVATAMAQVMRCHEYPTAARSPVTRRCYVEAALRGNPAAVTNLTTQAGVYDWASMPLKPTAGITDAQCEVIGKLTSDAGISVYMGYDLASKGGSGSFLLNVAKALMEVFGYANAAYYTADKDVSANAGVMKRAMFSNFDAGYPVVMGISGDGGHAIVGDGYGYNDGVPYVHLNMGWSGSYDFWYNLPDIDAGFYNFTVFDDLVFNIFPTADEGNATLSGRVTDDAGNAVPGASVRVLSAGAEVAGTQTDANGVWGVRLPSGSYEVVVAAAGCPVETRQVTVAATSTAKVTYSGWIVNGSWREEYKDVPTVTSVGNVWGTDVTLTAPRARIVLGAVTNVYATLDKALAAAKAFAAQPGVPGVAIELLDSIVLNATATLDFPCALTAVGVADAVAVTRSGNAALAVAAGGTLALSNVTFAAQSSTAVTVADGGQLVVASGVDFGVPASLAAVSTAASNGLVLAGELAHGFTLDCAAAPDVGGVFGTAHCDFLTASNCAARIANARDLHGETRGMAVEDGGEIRLTWGEIPVPVSEAAAYFVDASGATNAAARLDRVLEKYRNQQAAGQVGAACEIVVRDLAGLELTNRLAVAGALTLRGETYGVTIDTFGADAGFDVGTGASLTVKDLVFKGYKGDSLFKVAGGALTLQGGTELRDISGTKTHSGAVTVLAGTATVGSPDGAVIFDGCANDTQNSCGGAIYLKGTECELVLQNRVTITNGRVRKQGGGVYVGKGATVRLSGYLTIQDSVEYKGLNNTLADNLYFASGADQFILAGPLETGSAVGVWCASSLGNAGATFLTVDEGFADRAQIFRSCAALTSDKNEMLKAVPNDAYSAIVWEEDDGSIRPVDPSVAVARVTANGASEWYGSLEDAFGVLTGNATVEILRDDACLQGDVTVTNAVTLTSGAGGPFAVSRIGSRIGKFVVTAGGALTLANVTVWGGTGPAFEVTAGGALTLADGACIRDIASGATRVGGAITVVNGGTMTMLSGAAIRNCRSTGANYACGGAVAADVQSHLRLLGGEIAECVSSYGGVYVGNESTAEIGGDFTATNNVSESGAPNNLYVAANCRILLVSPLTGHVGYTPGMTVSSKVFVFGEVATNFSGTAAQVADSAHAFTHDVTGDVGLAVSGGDKRLLVWSDALGADGTVTVEGVDYELTPGGATLAAVVDVGQSVLSFVYDGTPKTCVLAGHGFAVVCEPQTKVGDAYTARATVKTGFAWADGTTEKTKTFVWKITKAVYDMSGVAFADKTVTYNGKPWSLEIAGKLPTGVSVSYTGNGQTEPGVYPVTATFAGDAENYEPIPAMTATLTILEKVDPPDPPAPGATTNVPTPIAFQAITRVSETEWTLTVTNRVPWCWYRLLATDDLTKGFVTTGAWEQATAEGAWTTNVTTSSGARFWKAEAKEGEVGK